jgi:hypothetical protein
MHSRCSGRLQQVVAVLAMACLLGAWSSRVPAAAASNPPVPLSKSRHRLDNLRSAHAKAILGGLHHEYSLARV